MAMWLCVSIVIAIDYYISDDYLLDDVIEFWRAGNVFGKLLTLIISGIVLLFLLPSLCILLILKLDFRR